MADTQFFTKTDQGINQYKAKIINGLESANQNGIISQDIFTFMNTYFVGQTSYIQREDVDNFCDNVKKILSDQDLRAMIDYEIRNIKKDGNLLKYGFDIISKIEDKVRKREQDKRIMMQAKAQKDAIEKAKSQDEIQRNQDIEELEKQLNNL